MLGFLLIAASPLLAQFPHSIDIGAPARKGVSRLDGGVYRITASGVNMWGATDAFHFRYGEFQGDISLEARVEWIGTGKNPHRKAGPIFRASLDPGAPYADFVYHGSGELALQYRKTKAGPTAEIQTTIRPPVIARLERHGNVISAEVSRDGVTWSPIGALTVAMPEKIYAGLAVCSHDDTAAETALIRDVKIEARGQAEKRVTESTLEVLDIETKQRRIVRRAKEHFEAPNWSRDHQLIYNSGGRLYSIPATGGTPIAIDTGERIRCNNDHGISPDGRWLAISDGSANRQSQIYVLPASGGTPRLVTPQFPSYWHGWSPDGNTLAYCARRNGNFDIYTIPVEGGEEKRLTSANGLDDGPDYSPDGKYIYFNSVRSGLMRIWRMLPDGSDQQMLIPGDDSADWFAHPSPDGKWIVYLSFEKTVEGHPPNKDVTLKLAPASGGTPRVIATLFGGQGTINVPSWSPDSRSIAFVSYRLVP